MIDDLEGLFPDPCEFCGAPAGDPECQCSSQVERPGLRVDSRSGLELIMPVDHEEQGRDRVREMLIERGFDPDEWEIDRLTVNEWPTPASAKTDRPDRMLCQTKAHLKRVVPLEDSPWGRFLLALQERQPRVARPDSRAARDPARPLLTVLMGDDQAPYVNRDLHEVTLAALADIKPDRFVYMGDGIDFDSISRHEPTHPEWTSAPQEGIDSTHRVLAERLEAAGWPPGHYIAGNHDIRLQKYLLKHVPKLFGLKQAATGLDVLSIPYLLNLEQLGLEYASSVLGDYPHPRVEIAPGYLAAHGWVARKGAGASAQASIERLNASIAVGHTHRLAVTHVTRWSHDRVPHPYTATETGTMADPRGLGYSVDPDWQPGWVTVTSWPDGRHLTELATWNAGSLTWRDQRWSLPGG